MIQSLLIWLAEKLCNSLLTYIFRKKSQSAAQKEAELFAKPDGKPDDIIDRL